MINKRFKNVWALSVFSALLILLLTECSKEINHVKRKKKTEEKQEEFAAGVNTMSDFVIVNAPKSQVSDIDASQDNLVTFKEGTQVEIPKGAFTLNGVVVTSGKINIEVKELQKQADMLMSGITTQSSAGLLQSSGMMYFEPTLNGQKLEINMNNPPVMYTKINTNKTKDLSGYIAFYLDAQMKWQPGNTVATPIYIGGVAYFSMPFTRIGWINCDRFYNYKNKCHVRCKLKDSFNANSRVYIVFNNIRSALMLYYNYQSQCFTTEGTAGVPSDEDMTLVCETIVDGKFYAEQKRISFTESPADNTHSINLPVLLTGSTPVAVSVDKHKAELNKIFDAE